MASQLAQRMSGNGAANGNGTALTINSLMQSNTVRQRFEDILGKKAAGFMSSVINVVNGNPLLKQCDPNQVVAAAAIAATMDLPIDPNLGFAYIIPYRQKGGGLKPQFQMGYRGYVQLAMRTGQYRTINATEVYEGEIKSRNRITGKIEIDPEGKKSDEIVGYAAYFELINGFEKYEYMTVDEVRAHAKRFSQSYGKDASPWTTDFDEMAKKTVLKRLLSKYGILSIEMHTAHLADQATVIEREDGTVDYEYPDNQTVEAEYTVAGDEGESQTEESGQPGLDLSPDPRGF